jgi:outer membrane protein OmpA-like peptidoglycan-associated protein
MKTTKLMLLALAVSASGCMVATLAPRELVDARAEYNRALATETAKVAAADLYDARRLLDAANQAAANGEDPDRVRDLAYLAQRKVELANSRARTEVDWREIIAARRAVENLRTEQAKNAATAKAQLDAERNRAQQELAEANADRDRLQRDISDRTAALEDQTRATRRLQAQLDEQLQKLSKIADVKQDDRGTVITLSGSVLFASGQASLLGPAMLRLDQVAEALKSVKGGPQITVEGHTDSIGTSEYNQQLSLSRAQVVRDYLVGRGISASRIDAYGFGSSRPLVDNNTPENRANNRRVEIVIHGGPVSLR